MADFKYETWFSMKSNADYFQLNILMAGEYVPGQKKEITNWHDLANLLIEVRNAGAMAVLVPAKTSYQEDNTKGRDALNKYVDQGKGWGFLQIETWVERGYNLQKRLLSDLEVYRPYPDQLIFNLVAKIGDVRWP